jgi:dTDP-4-dehydrorhamnose 3,5-epimerase
MSNFEFNKCYYHGNPELCFEGLLEIVPKVHSDGRGFFVETFNLKEFSDNIYGFTNKFVKDNLSRSSRFTIRGMHFQKHFPQAKLVRAAYGKVVDVVVDMRNGLPTFGRYYSVLLDSDMQNQLYVPRGFAHGFMAVSDEAYFSYKCDEYYHPEDEGGVAWDSLDIPWRALLPGGTGLENEDIWNPNLSMKDLIRPAFSDEKNYFDPDGRWHDFVSGKELPYAN